MYDEDTIEIDIDIDRLRDDMRNEALGAFFGGGFGGGMVAAMDVDNASDEELIKMALIQGIDLGEY